MKIIDFLNKNLYKMGAQIVRYPNPDLKRKAALLHYNKINKVFDVGANVGEYAIELRKIGFNGKIISFEPLSSAFKKLNNNAYKDSKWETVNIALGSKDEESYINIAGNTDNSSSSLLEMLPTHLNSAPESAYIGKEKIIIRRLDSIIQEYYYQEDNLLLKIDTQGFEKEVLNGAEQSLEKIKGIQLEMSLLPLYSESILYIEMIELLQNKGFKLNSLENGFSNPKTGQLLQIDGIFYK